MSWPQAHPLNPPAWTLRVSVPQGPVWEEACWPLPLGCRRSAAPHPHMGLLNLMGPCLHVPASLSFLCAFFVSWGFVRREDTL